MPDVRQIIDTAVNEQAWIDINGTFSLASQITPACTNWCAEQHFANDFQFIVLVVLAVVVLAVQYLFKIWEFKIMAAMEKKYTLHEFQTLQKIINKAPELAFYLLIGFLVMFVWFT